MPEVDLGFILLIGGAALAVLVPFAILRGRERRAMERLGLGPDGRMLEPQPKHPVVVRYFPNRQLRSGGLLTFCTACPSALEFTVRRRGRLDGLARHLLGLPYAITGDPTFDRSATYYSADLPGSIKALQIERVRHAIRSILGAGCQELTLSKNVVTAQWRGSVPGHTAVAFEAVARDMVSLAFDLALVPENPEVAPARVKALKRQQRAVLFAVLAIFAASAASGEFAPIAPWEPVVLALALALPLWIIRYRVRSATSKGALLERVPWEGALALGWLGTSAALLTLLLSANATLDQSRRIGSLGIVVTKWIVKKGSLRFGYATLQSEALERQIEIPVTPESFSAAEPGKVLPFTYLPGALGFAWQPGPVIERSAAMGREPAGRKPPPVRPLNID